MGSVRKKVVATAAGVAAVLVAGAVVGGVVWKQQRDAAQAADAAAQSAATSFAKAWSARSLTSARYADRSPKAVARDFASATAALGKAPVHVTVADVHRTGDTAAATLSVAWTLSGGTTWRYQDPVRLVKQQGGWAVDARQHSLWHPKLPRGGTFAVQQVAAKRGAILDGTGAALMADQTVHDIAIDPVRSTDQTVSALEQVVGFPAGSLVAKLHEAKKSGSKAPIPVITYRDSDFAPRKGRLSGIPGVVVTERQQPLAQTREFGQPLLGTVGPVTKEIVDHSNGRYQAGDYAGTSGLQAQYDAWLAGKPGLTITATGGSSGSKQGETVLFQRKPVNGKPLKLTLRTKVQEAAEKALADASTNSPSALVAVDVKTGALLAVANSPAFGADRALKGQFQPGSTLKVATAYSVLSHGLDPQKTVNCPAATTIDGLRITNYANEAFGPISFAMDFAHSCNTAFADVSTTMGDADLHQAALALGIGRDWHLGVDGTFTGSVPVANGATDKAASAFGQARTLASPAAMAVMAGSVARGAYLPPSLVVNPKPQGLTSKREALQQPAGQELQQLMRLVVEKGTGQPLQGVPGPPVHAKTGTAEHSGTHPHAWMVGWQGDVAFGVLVEKGKSGEVTAGPIAKDFLTQLQH
ncbi:MAG TPA: penicillin-binding transpeptidase domain-containing protein [Segeticoccus sp.]|uniref:penicillin-binding transpeptidase domain-containing protein n=1 Tax=Segeticoccus sp. TaxID=2706531 RepID=UPI002D80526B|nr:penicillin-binding transpeptidase domain-containing protein [Segeticoccus sp.]HET8601498.1 penicillin-binding transpeptidase domain-containing protein [Segeticoccus sp.]